MLSTRRIARTLLVVLATGLVALAATAAQAATSTVPISGTFVEQQFLNQVIIPAGPTGGGTTFVTVIVGFSGSLVGTETVKERASFQADGTLQVTHDGTFTGTIAGRSGSVQILDAGTQAPGDTLIRGSFTFVNGSGGLAGIHGQGTFTAIPGTSGTYQGEVFFN